MNTIHVLVTHVTTLQVTIVETTEGDVTTSTATILSMEMGEAGVYTCEVDDSSLSIPTELTTTLFLLSKCGNHPE